MTLERAAVKKWQTGEYRGCCVLLHTS